jgi:hypothetical protein
MGRGATRISCCRTFGTALVCTKQRAESTVPCKADTHNCLTEALVSNPIGKLHPCASVCHGLHLRPRLATGRFSLALRQGERTSVRQYCHHSLPSDEWRRMRGVPDLPRLQHPQLCCPAGLTATTHADGAACVSIGQALLNCVSSTAQAAASVGDANMPRTC